MPLLRSFRPRSIVVLRALPFGDLLCAVPALRALRHECPHASITLVGLPRAGSLVDRYRHYLDDFMPFPGFPGFPEPPPNPPAFARFVLDARSRAFDLAVQLHDDGRVSNRVGRLLGARRFAGFRRKGDSGGPDRRKDTYLRYPEHGHEIRRLLALTRFLGAEDDDESLEFPLLAADLAELRASGVAHGLEPGRYLCVHPGARAASRRWPAEHFAAVADALHEATGLPVVLTGSPERGAPSAEVHMRMRAPALDAAASLSVGALAALLADARLLIANDTGVSHLAAALRVPSVVVFRDSDPERWAPLDTSLHRAVVDGSVDEVLARARELLAGSPGDDARRDFLPAMPAAQRIRAGAP